MDEFSVEPEWRLFRPEECVPLGSICVSLRDCVCVRPGPVAADVLDVLARKGYDQAPVYDPEPGICHGLAHASHLRELCREGRALEPDDPHVCDEAKVLRFNINASIYQVILKMKQERAIIVIRESDEIDNDRGVFYLGLLTISDLNRHEVCCTLHRLFTDVEAAVSRVMEKHIPEPRDWISLLEEAQQERILGYWELARQRNVDIGPSAAATIADLLAVIGKSEPLGRIFGFTSHDVFRKHERKLPEFRDRLTRQAQPLVLEHEDVHALYTVTRILEKFKNRAIEEIEPAKA